MSDTDAGSPSDIEWGEDNVRVTLRVPAALMAEFEEAVDKGHYAHQSEAIREAMRWYARLVVPKEGESDERGDSE